MSAPNNIPTTPTGSNKAAKDPYVEALMAGNHLDLGMNGLAGSIWATPGKTYGFKKEVLVRMAAEAAEEKRLEELEISQKAKGNAPSTVASSGNGTSNTGTTNTGPADGRMEVDAPSSNVSIAN